jgi:hypothetical protein
MILITSAAYITKDFITEIGNLPPSFLPIGNRRLFRYQIDELQKIDGDVYLSIPQDFEIDEYDRKYLEKRKVVIIQVPEGLTLGESIVYCWNSAEKNYESLRLLHGDTLIRGISLDESDGVSIGMNAGYYPRAVVNEEIFTNTEIQGSWAGDDDWVLSGYFSFSEPRLLVQSIVRSRGDFIAGLNTYNSKHQLKNLKEGEWLDFGHINTFYRSRSSMTTQREFNEMLITHRLVTKSSHKKKKMVAEASWFKKIPAELRIYLPHLISDNTNQENASYSIEYLYLLPLSDLYVFGNLPSGAWRQILRSCRVVADEFDKVNTNDQSFLQSADALYLPKTLSRLNEYTATGFDINSPLKFAGVDVPSLVDIACATASSIPPAEMTNIGLLHGDYCFSNILYDARLQSVRLIDPRGIDGNDRVTIFGDRRYDLAKLYHSVIGLYDYILAGRYTLNMNKENNEFFITFSDSQRFTEIQTLFRTIFFGGDTKAELQILAITIHLFLSMLPLHSDRPDAQNAMVANALRLYVEYQKLKGES